MFIKNAIIESTTLDMGDRDILTAWLHLDYGNTFQGFGGYTLYLPKSYTHHNEASKMNYAGHWIYRVMQIAGVENWEKLKGKSIRVKLDNDGLGGSILAVGHIVKDDWFNPKEEFEKLKLL